jgi:hypothetical protein
MWRESVRLGERHDLIHKSSTDRSSALAFATENSDQTTRFHTKPSNQNRSFGAVACAVSSMLPGRGILTS